MRKADTISLKSAPRIEIDLAKIYQNTKRLKHKFSTKNVSMMGVTKGVLGSPAVAAAMTAAGVDFIADSRIENIKRIKEAGIKNKFVLIRTPSMSKIHDVVKYADISLNTEIEIVRLLSEEALALKKIHKIVLMVDLGDLREGILPGDMASTFRKLREFKGIQTIGIGTNLGCIGAIVPDQKKMDELSRIVFDLEKKFNIDLHLISGGNSANYRWFDQSRNLGRINNLRIGEMVYTGCDTINYQPIDLLECNTSRLVADIIEIKEKESLPSGTVCTDAFGNVPVFSDRGKISRAILGLGRQDVLIQGLTPVEDMEIIGASSDHITIDLKDSSIQIGDEIHFNLTYGALVSAMTSPYIEKVYLNEKYGEIIK